MNLEQAIDIANGYFGKKGQMHVIETHETENVWLFLGGEEDLPQMDPCMITVSKADGSIERIVAPSKEFFKLLHEIEEFSGEA